MHIRPWEIELLTVDQLDLAIQGIDAYLEAHRKAGESSGG
jgi:hypothetical protein